MRLLATIKGQVVRTQFVFMAASGWYLSSLVADMGDLTAALEEP
jgi:hypothetical protein